MIVTEVVVALHPDVVPPLTAVGAVPPPTFVRGGRSVAVNEIAHVTLPGAGPVYFASLTPAADAGEPAAETPTSPTTSATAAIRTECARTPPPHASIVRDGGRTVRR